MPPVVSPFNYQPERLSEKWLGIAIILEKESPTKSRQALSWAEKVFKMTLDERIENYKLLVSEYF